ncbi:hypothetical protein KC19_5G177800 [Ceratodon purpureus]|uniref:LysM domain-containing protein n=1 Tax=Ceratodon purpureus TaxID=3225 RepID=A0A8T0I5P6_CERPU|nr:hypothetical protein KC19_5G177800 [Ceratodon purpureus]
MMSLWKEDGDVERKGRECFGSSGGGRELQTELLAMEVADFAFLFASERSNLHCDLLRLIFARLSPPLLARVACVSRTWRTVATDPAVLMGCFKADWKLREVVGVLPGRNFFARGMRQFAISHPLQRWDTVDSLAVKYDVEATEIRNLNNMSSDHDIHRRRRLLIPVLKPELLVGKTCYIESDEHAKCELAVLYLRGESNSSKGARRSEWHTIKKTSVLGDSRVAGNDTLRHASSSAGTSTLCANAIPDVAAEITAARGALAGFDMGRGMDEFRPSASVQEKGKFVKGDEIKSVPIRRVEENVSGLTDDLWRMILECLPVTTLGQAACVCRLWHSIATDPATLASAFMAPWKLKAVVGRPMSKSFWRGQLGQLAISHTLQRQDTMAGLAVKYGVQVPEIRRVNNMMSDHGIHSRERLLIPISHPEILAGQTCFIEVDVFAKREVGVVYLDGSKPNLKESARVAEKAQHRLKKEVMESLKRSLKVDDSTAQYYFSLDNGDLRGALQEFSEDLQWERDAQ